MTLVMNPIQGDPGRVSAEGKALLRSAETIRQAAAALRRMADQSTYSSDAIDAARRNADDLARVMDDSQRRFQDAGQALVEYAPKLDAAQGKAERAINALGHTDVAGATATVAASKAAQLASAANPLASPEERSADELAYRRASARLAEQAGVALAAKKSYDQAWADLEVAARAAMERIHAANKASKLNDTLGDHFKNWKETILEPTLEAVTKVLAVVSDILTVVGVIAAFVPGLQPLAAALIVVGRIVAIVSLVTTAIKCLVGDISLGEFAAAMLFAAGGFLLKKVVSVVRKVPAPAKDPIETMGVRAGGAEMVRRFQSGSILWDEGSKAVIDVGKGEVKSAILGPAEDFLAGQVDSMVDPDDVWSTDELASHDVAPLASDFSAVDPASLVANSFGESAVGDAPLTAGSTR
jgi:hypothetical protein